jgi:acylphosphatase
VSAQPPHERVEVRIEGRVQGVSFRAYAREEARRLGLTGWVKNEPDGAVSAVAEGPREALERFVLWCHRGSPHAVVTGVDAGFGPARGETDTFEISRLE